VTSQRMRLKRRRCKVQRELNPKFFEWSTESMRKAARAFGVVRFRFSIRASTSGALFRSLTRIEPYDAVIRIYDRLAT
jgi:hypothetical protein